MAKMEIGIYDVLDQAQMESHAVAADVYDEHIRGAQEAEQMGYQYYFSIEHQSSDVSFLSSPSVYLTALGPSHQYHAVRRDDLPVALSPSRATSRRGGDAGPLVPGPGGVRRRHRRHLSTNFCGGTWTSAAGEPSARKRWTSS